MRVVGKASRKAHNLLKVDSISAPATVEDAIDASEMVCFVVYTLDI